MENIIKGFETKLAGNSVTGVLPNLRSGLRTKKSHGVLSIAKPKSNISIAPRSKDNPVPTPTAKVAAALASASSGSSTTTKGSGRSSLLGTAGGNRGLQLGKRRFGTPTGKFWTSVFKF